MAFLRYNSGGAEGGTFSEQLQNLGVALLRYNVAGTQRNVAMVAGQEQ